MDHISANDKFVTGYGVAKSNNSLDEYIAKHSVHLSVAQQFIIKKTHELSKIDLIMSTIEMQLLSNLCYSINALKTIDVGTFTGYSALSIAEVLPPNGRVVTLDITDQYLDEYCIPAWRMAGVESKIDFRKNLAIKSLEELVNIGESETFDFALIDADKANYVAYYELCLKLIRPKGIIAIDNVLWSGKVINEFEQDRETVGIRQFNAHVAHDERVRLSFLKLADGLTIAVKK